MTKETSLYKTTKAIWYVFYIIETLLLFRFILKLLGANPGAGFTNFIYSVSGVFVAPFQYVFGTNTAGSSAIEWSVLLAMLVYWFLAWGIIKFVLMGRSVDSVEAERGLEAQDDSV